MKRDEKRRGGNGGMAERVEEGSRPRNKEAAMEKGGGLSASRADKSALPWCFRKGKTD